MTIRIENYEGYYKMLSVALERCPWYTVEDMKRQYNICIAEYGFVHDTGFEVVFFERDIFEDSEDYGSGWKTIEKDYNEALRKAKQQWDFNAEYGWH